MTDYLKIPEVARRLDVSEPTVRRMVKGGKLPSVFVGGAYRVSEEDLEKYLEAARVDPGDGSGKGRPPQPKVRAAAQSEDWQEGLAEAYRAAAKEGRAALRTPKPDFERVGVFHDLMAGLARARGGRDILGRESDALADAIAEVEDVDDQVQVRIQEWFADAPEEEKRSTLEQIGGTKYEVVLNAGDG